MKIVQKRSGDDPAVLARGYMARLPAHARRELKKLRSIIRAAAPGSAESLSYGIPAFTLGGRGFIWYAAWTEHLSLYPVNAAMRRGNAAALRRFKLSKGTIRFPLTAPLPVGLVRQLVKARVAELSKAAKR
jgi:uncharacterized protein YdhG (YjbR/CyaY superfamily)